MKTPIKTKVLTMLDERFIHPLSILEPGSGAVRIYVAFRKRNHLIPCTTRRRKSMRKKAPRLLVASNPAVDFSKCIDDQMRAELFKMTHIEGNFNPTATEIARRRQELIDRWGEL